MTHKHRFIRHMNQHNQVYYKCYGCDWVVTIPSEEIYVAERRILKRKIKA